MTDFTKLLDRLEPPQDGESPVRHRTGTVDAVNSDGTVDLDLGGVVVDSVAVLAGAFIAVGATVQVVVWRGDLLVLGAARAANQGGPLGVLGYAEVTSNQTVIAGNTDDLTGLSVTVNVAGRRLNITGQTIVSPSGAGAGIVTIQEGTTELNRAGQVDFAVGGDEHTFSGSAVITPTSGSHTYKLTLRAVSANMDSLAASTFPAFILVEDIGPA